MKLKSLLILAVAILLASCSTDEPEPVVYVAEMSSFGFFAEDNEGVILQDYVVSPINQTSINILLPEEVDKTKLVARFTVSENDVVKVGETVQQSGVTANDFTGPVDFIVSEGTTNVKYTVTIGKAPAYVWTALPAVEENMSAAVMKVNPAGIPYIAYKMDRDATDDEGLGLMVLKDGVWSLLGQVSNGRVESYFDIAFNSEGHPAVSYLDYTSKISRQASVKAWNGTTWKLLGDTTATNCKILDHGFNFVNDNKVMLFGMIDATNASLAKRELSVNTFENGKWSYNNPIPGRASTIASKLIKSVKMGENVYVIVYNAISPNTISVYQYDNKNWTVLIENWTDVNATSIALKDIAFDVDRENNIYIALADNSKEGVGMLRVIKYEAETKQISSVGSYLGATSGGSFNFDLAISPLGVPYVFFRNESHFPTVVYLDNDTQDWTTPNVMETAEADDLSIDFAPDGKAYITYTKSNKLYSYKYDAPQQ